MMALYHYCRLTTSRKRKWRHSPLVLLCFPLPVKWLLSQFSTGNCWIWNRHYYEHSIALLRGCVKLSTECLKGLRLFMLGHPTIPELGPMHYQKTTPATGSSNPLIDPLWHDRFTFDELQCLLDSFFNITTHWVRHFHLVMPRTPTLVAHLNDLKHYDDAQRKRTRKDTTSNSSSLQDADDYELVHLDDCVRTAPASS